MDDKSLACQVDTAVIFVRKNANSFDMTTRYSKLLLTKHTKEEAEVSDTFDCNYTYYFLDSFLCMYLVNCTT